MIKFVCLLLSASSLFSASKLPFLYNCWNFNGTTAGVNGQPFEIASPQFTNGVFGSALRCDGTTNSTGVAIGTGTFAYHQDFTGMFWFTPKSLAENQTVFDSINPGGSGRGMVMKLGGIGVAGTLRFGLKEGSLTKYVYSAAPLVVDETYCVLFGYNAVTQRSFIRVNGVQVDSSIDNLIVPTSLPPGNLAIGISPNLTGLPLDGVIDLFTLWKGKVLSNAEMLELEAGLNYPYP